MEICETCGSFLIQHCQDITRKKLLHLFMKWLLSFLNKNYKYSSRGKEEITGYGNAINPVQTMGGFILVYTKRVGRNMRIW
ncbi:hypothetical protein CJ215_01130 [Gardnerella swidsinskii]|nr:hypothetical protein CJ215_01130 [Gardnerella vaginalis]